MSELDDRYRRLLRWYPRDHRERHGEEMLGVLLAGAGERTRPSRKETVDLLLGALRLHARRVVGADGGIDHRDVLAIVSLLGPIAILAGAAYVAETLNWSLRTGFLFDWNARDYLAFLTDLPVWVMWFVVAVLSLFRLRRLAAVGAWLGTFGFLVSASVGRDWFEDAITASAGWVVLGLVTAVALTWSPGPARGWELVGRRRVLVLAAAVVASIALVMKSFGTYDVLYVPVENLTGFPDRLVLWFLALAVVVAGAVVAGGARTRDGRRAALVLCVPVMVSVLLFVLPRLTDRTVTVAVCYGVPVAVLVAFGGVWRRARVSA